MTTRNRKGDATKTESVGHILPLRSAFGLHNESFFASVAKVSDAVKHHEADKVDRFPVWVALPESDN